MFTTYSTCSRLLGASDSKFHNRDASAGCSRVELLDDMRRLQINHSQLHHSLSTPINTNISEYELWTRFPHTRNFTPICTIYALTELLITGTDKQTQQLDSQHAERNWAKLGKV